MGTPFRVPEEGDVVFHSERYHDYVHRAKVFITTNI